jgi:putative Mn2+ efflux pump MntP
MSQYVSGQTLRALATSRLGLAILPLILSLDNFIGGAALEMSPRSIYADAATTAVASFLMTLAGCAFGGALVGRSPRFVWPLAGSASLAAAIAMTLS